MKYNYGIVFIFLIFANVFESKIAVCTYWDEAVTLLVMIYGSVQLIKKDSFCIRKSKLRYWGFLGLLVAIGLLGNVWHPGLQNSSSVVVRDIMALCKFFIILLVFDNVDYTVDKQSRILEVASEISKVIILITFVCAVVGYFTNNLFYTGEIRVVKCFQFVFSHPTFFVSSYVMIMGILIADSLKKNRFFIFLNCILIFMAQRTKGMIVVVLVLAMLFLGEDKCIHIYNKVSGPKKRGQLNGKLCFLIILVASLAWYLMKDKVSLYFSWGLSAARPALYIVGLQIMLKFFPTGSGFGTFASSLSGRYYSGIYDLFRISNVSGITRNSHNYVGDVFWPYIYGQFGIFGLIIYIKMIIHCIEIYVKENFIVARKFAIIVLWVYALMASTAEAFFTNSSAVQMALIIGIYIGKSNEEERVMSNE